MAESQARFDITTDLSGQRIMVLEGDWTAFTVGGVDKALRELHTHEASSDIFLDVSQLEELDTAGAYVIDRTLREIGAVSGENVKLLGEHQSILSLLTTVSNAQFEAPHKYVSKHPILDLLERVGHGVVDAFKEGWGILEFIGEAFATIFHLCLHPSKIRWTSVVAIMEEAGLNALPIVSMLSFFIGIVVAFLGVNLLQSFGAQVFTVEMVGFLMLREFGLVLTAILLAGRTDSAFTAEIGAMKMREEIDAMRVMGLNPMEVLVAPRLIALWVMTPFLSFFAMISGLIGGLLVMWGVMDISPAMFIQRINDTVPGQNFWVGMAKAPVFATVIALVGCRQGLLVSGDVQSLGNRTTSSVVQAIFLVIVLDAIFAMLYMEMGL
ncbi:MlaE family ABC transporter permease [Hirschia litorea]|uniref:MlaE family ABC transporter permease n=1 Tax=Hirschia litorea TaxID=1199156 RepID=A0ABW2ILY5_9PROT